MKKFVASFLVLVLALSMVGCSEKSMKFDIGEASKIELRSGTDGTVTEKAFLIACGNASQYGNNAYIAPHASMQDGKIDVTVLMPFTPFDTAALALLLFTKHIDQDSNIKSFTTESLTIKREKPGAIHLDGEPIEMGTRIDVRCFKGGLHALIPSGEPKRSIIEPFASVFWEFIETVRQELNI